MSNSILLKNCHILDGTSSELRENQDVLIVDNKIEEISETRIKTKANQQFNLKGRTLMPGLIDAHVHVAAPMLNLGVERKIPASYTSVQAAIFLKNMLQRGYTSVRDAGGADFGLAMAIEKGIISGPRLFYSGRALSQTGGHGDFREANAALPVCGCHTESCSSMSQIVDGVTAVRIACREELRKGATQIKVMAAGGVTSPADKITDMQFSREELLAIVEETNARNTYVMAHVFTSEGIQRCIDCGVRTIEHGFLLNEKVAGNMADKGVFLVPTFTIVSVIIEVGKTEGLTADSIEKMKSVISTGYQALEYAKKKKVKIGFASDVFGSVAHAVQSREFLLRAEAENPFEVIKSATLINAEILNYKDKLGVISPHAYADLIVVNGNPLRDLKLLTGQGEHLDLIMKNGVIYKNTC